MSSERLKRLTANPIMKEAGRTLPYVALEHIESDLGRTVAASQPEDREDGDAVLFEPGDVLFGKLRPYLAKVLHVDYHGCASGELLVMRPRAGLDSRYLFYVALSRPFIEWANATSYGVKMPRTSWEQLGDYEVHLPALQVQRAIADFLDRDTAHIDNLIEKKRQLRDRLGQRRLEMARVATTRGLSSGSKVRETGVNWLGPIAEGWRLWRLGYAFKTGSGTTPYSQNPDYYGGEIPWLTTSELRDKSIASTQQSVTEAALKDYPALRIFPPGSVVVAMYGATIGRVGLVEIESTTNQACCVLYESEVLMPKFAFYWLWAHRRHIVALGSGGGQGNISQETIRDLRIPTPPLTEQEDIVAFLDFEGSRLAQLETRLDGQVELLREHRRALITAGVTGQMDVSKVA